MGVRTTSRTALRRLYGTTTRNGSIMPGHNSIGRMYGDSLMGGTPTETTTSFRTGKSYDHFPTDLEFGGGTWSDAFDAIMEESKNNSSGLRPGDNGHNFSTTKVIMQHCRMGSCAGKVGDDVYTYRGHIVPISNLGFPGFGSFGAGFNASNYGARAVKATIPTSSDMDLSVALAELKKDGLPSLPRVGNPGNEYLNYEFGAKPLKDDIESLLETTISWRRKLEQYHRDSNKTVRRSYRFEPETLSERLSLHESGKFSPVSGTTAIRDLYFDHPFNDTINYSAVWFRTDRLSTREVWFNGAYTYNLNQNVGGMIGKVKSLESDLQKLVGTRADADLVWNLLPWTWFVDWNSSIGNILGNAEAFSRDGCVMKFGYLMSHTRVTLTLTGRDVYGRTFPLVLMKDTKERVRANPYGFTLSTAGYTDRQWAILAALGMTKAPKVLKWLS